MNEDFSRRLKGFEAVWKRVQGAKQEEQPSQAKKPQAQGRGKCCRRCGKPINPPKGPSAHPRAPRS